MNITVFASSSPRTPQMYLDVAATLGRLCAEEHITLVNGGGNSGCMGAMTDACLAAGGHVHGIILRKFQEENLGHDQVGQMDIAENMRDRKRLLMDHCDACITLAGGPGTWEEFWEFAVERQIDTHIKPLILINTNGFYDGFIQQTQRAHREGFLYSAPEKLFHIATDPEEALNMLCKI